MLWASSPSSRKQEIHTSSSQLTVGGNVGEALQLTPLPLAVADVEVDVNGGGEALRPVRRDFNQQRVLQHKAFPVPLPESTAAETFQQSEENVSSLRLEEPIGLWSNWDL